MKNKKPLVMSSLLVVIVLLGIGTIAYFRRTVNGDITGQAGNLVLIVNEADAVLNETFLVTLKRSETENFIMPDDKGIFNLNIDSTGSSDDVAATITISRLNLPENLKFYLDEDYTEELTTKTFIIEKSDDMTMTVPVYWFWDGSISDEDDSNFINTEISANISVSATIFMPFVETLINKATLDTNVDFSQHSSEINGIGLMMREGTQDNEYPIVYYRGDVNNNNVIYAGYCWLIVRTTETGGVKLIYNGDVNDDGSCSNYSNVTVEGVNNGVTPTVSAPELEPGEYDDFYQGAYIYRGTQAFNTSKNSPVYVGYMYNDDNLYFADGTLDVDGYKSHLADNTIYEGAVVESRSMNNAKTKLQLMATIDQATGRHNQNKYDSNIKTVIDDWYQSNIEGTVAENLLEDTVWCADRSVTSTTYSIDNYVANHSMFRYSAYTRLIEPLWDEDWNFIMPTTPIEPSLSCARDIDKFTVDRANGNGDLTYPISMLTADEFALAGNVYVDGIDLVTTYLTLPNAIWGAFWALSPNDFSGGNAFVVLLYPNGMGSDLIINWYGVRPSVSLGLGAQLQGGDGSFASPYNFD